MSKKHRGKTGSTVHPISSELGVSRAVPSSGIFDGVHVVSQVLNRMEISNSISLFRDKDLPHTRFLLLVGIHEDGSVFYRAGGAVTELELDGLRVAADDILDSVQSKLDY